MDQLKHPDQQDHPHQLNINDSEICKWQQQNWQQLADIPLKKITTTLKRCARFKISPSQQTWLALKEAQREISAARPFTSFNTN